MSICGRNQIVVTGTVQGVGFRPFIARTATTLGLAGFVTNTPEGVQIEVQGPPERLEAFLEALRQSPPPLARIQSIESKSIAILDEASFVIAPSRSGAGTTTMISPDIAPCAACAAELLDPQDRRHRYPFINCTDCGPRYSIIQGLPYDRPQTTMKPFAMCEACATEYADPTDRRFHAQPDACETCGPKISFVVSQDRGLVVSHDPLHDTIAALDEGAIVAIKGVGGFHLACDAQSDAAVCELRRRKRRDEKPFALMVKDLDAARAICHVDETEAQLLTSPERPIVLLRKRDAIPVAQSVAPGNQRLGVMLPSSPLHHLLFHGSRVTSYESRIFVMTSANISDEPIVHTNDEACSKLADIADAFLMHDRDIHVRIDDSIARTMNGRALLMRRARGFVPAPIRMKRPMPPILATGADLKGAICVTRGHNAILSQHLGDLQNAEAHRGFEETVEHLTTLFAVRPEIIACDLHPDYFSTRFAETISRSLDLTKPRDHETTISRVQHHHAHIASCMAENDLPNEPVIGIALDGTGFGTDGTIWGGELLIADYEGFTRAARFKPVPMPGGDAAAREPWRMALAYLRTTDHGPWTKNQNLFPSVPREKIDLVRQVLEKRINCPMTSSCGRLFDAIAALIGLRTVNTFEGQAAMELEQIAADHCDEAYPYTIETRDSRHETRDHPPLQIGFERMIEQIVNDAVAGISPSIISARFHNTLIETISDACRRIRSRFTVHGSRVCLSGGCFQNACLAEGLKKKLVDQGFTVYTHALVPPNDGGIALGQTIVAAHRAERQQRP